MSAYYLSVQDEVNTIQIVILQCVLKNLLGQGGEHTFM